MVNFRFASQEDSKSIGQLLSSNGLPYKDYAFHLLNFIIGVQQKSIVGCAAIDTYDDHALIRSVAVHKDHQGKGIGKQLFQRIIALARQQNVQHLHLLTTTADQYFQKLGFELSEREAAPLSIRSTFEFSTLCSSASYLINRNISRYPLFFDHKTQLLQKDPETNSVFWAIETNHSKFTFFEVPPNAVFSKHTHASEQITYVLEGCLYFRINGEVFPLAKGDCIAVPPHCEHEVYAELEGARAVDSWSRIHSGQL